MQRLSPFILAIFQTQILFLLLMSMYRFWFYTQYTPYPLLPKHLSDDLLEAFWLGMRLDLSILGYVNTVALLIVALMQASRIANRILVRALITYFWVAYLLIAGMMSVDLAFYSYFGEHINIMFFGVFDDDTSALMQIAVKNYNLPLIGAAVVIFGFLTWKIVAWIFYRRETVSIQSIPWLWYVFLVTILISLSVIAIRGSFGTFPISKNIKDVSHDPFINKLPHNGIYAFSKAYKLYMRSKSNKYNLIQSMGFEHNISEAFVIHKPEKTITNDLLSLLHERTPKNRELEQKPPHVVVVMVESFGLPITNYQSERFNIMGRLKPHFDQGIVFQNFISGSNGTISSLEPLLLNIAARPESTPFGQSRYAQTSFLQASAKVYKTKGYETSFVYGGDLSWRNIGDFIKYQGFDHVEGKTAISESVGTDSATSMHTWGIYDQYTYDYVIRKLLNASTPQFIYVLTTNNHPPYDIPSDYISQPLEWSQEMQNHMVGDKILLQKRLKDYAYALDMAGRFMDRITSESTLNDTVVAITADNNTIEYGMKYDNPIDESKRIPLYLYLPERLKPTSIDTSVPGSHKDLFPTLYNLTLSDADYISTGVNLLDQRQIHCGFNNGGIIVSKEGAFEIDKFKNKSQEKCNRYYKATMAVGEYLILSHDTQQRIKKRK